PRFRRPQAASSAPAAPERSDVLQEAFSLYYTSARGSTSLAVFQRPLDLPLLVPPGDGFPLVPLLLSSGQGHLHLGNTPLVEVNAQRNEGDAAFLQLARQPPDLILVQQQLPRAGRLVVEPVPKRIRADMQVVQPHLPIPDEGVAVPQVRQASPQRLHFRARQHDARFKRVRSEEHTSELQSRENLVC